MSDERSTSGPARVGARLAAPLSAEEQRVLGSLLEKEVTVPASYPMTLGAVRTACNQSSSREPVVTYDEGRVQAVLKSLKDRDLVTVTWADSGRRTLKYVQTVAARWGLDDDVRAVLTVLLLRGAQPPGALRSRTERLHAFADRDEVAACLHRMASADPPLVAELPRRPREQDARWVHLLGEADDDASTRAGAASAAAPDDTGESVLRDGEQARTDRVRTTFEAVAADYAEAFGDELVDLPFERWLLERVAGGVAGRPVVEVGCGPGHVTAHLAGLGVDAHGLDLSPAMVEQARARHPGIDVEVGDLRRLMRPTTSDGWGAVLAWYSLIYLAPSELAEAVAALVRPLAPGGLLVLALHAGSGVLSADTWFDHAVELEVVRHPRDAVVDVVRGAGLVDVEWYLRGPVTERSETTERLYVVARRS